MFCGNWSLSRFSVFQVITWFLTNNGALSKSNHKKIVPKSQFCINHASHLKSMKKLVSLKNCKNSFPKTSQLHLCKRCVLKLYMYIYRSNSFCYSNRKDHGERAIEELYYQLNYNSFCCSNRKDHSERATQELQYQLNYIVDTEIE